MRGCLHEENIFVIDTGFRDSLHLLSDLGFESEMFEFLKKGQKTACDLIGK